MDISKLNFFEDNKFFSYAAIAAIVGLLFIFLDFRKKRKRLKRRIEWAKRYGFQHSKAAPRFIGTWNKGLLADQSERCKNVSSVVIGKVVDKEIMFFDDEPFYTLMAIEDKFDSDFEFELRRVSAIAPSGTQWENIQIIGSSPEDWILFSNNKIHITEEFIDLLETFEGKVGYIWQEEDWLVGTLPRTRSLEKILSELAKLSKLSDALKAIEKV